jgi:putative ABC transport system permease protein
VTGIDVSLGEVAASLVLVAIAIGITFWRRTGLERDYAVAVARSFVQLIAIGYVIQAIFDEDSLLLSPR